MKPFMRIRHFFRRAPKYSIGIDFGTTVTRLCFIDNTKDLASAVTIRPLRSLVTAVPKPSQNPKYVWHVGEDVIDDHWAHYEKFKLKIGKMKPIELLPRRKKDEIIAIRPEIIAAAVIAELKEIAGDEKEILTRIRDVTITVPAEWNAIQRQATIMAGRIAGFSNIALIEEPVAAYLAITATYQSDRVENSQIFVVFDFGGGTLDVTVIHRPRRGLPYVISRSMDQGNLAGEMIDEKLCPLVYGRDVWKDLTVRDKKHLRKYVREMKESLNPAQLDSKPMANATYPEEVTGLDNRDLVFKRNSLVLQKDDLDRIIQPIADVAIEHIEKAIKTSIIDERTLVKEDIDAVFLVGGSSYLRIIQEEIINYFDNKRIGDGIYLESPEKAVAIGAALYRAYIDRGDKKVKLHVPLHTYLEYVTKDEKKEKLPLDEIDHGQLPIEPKPPIPCPVPRNIPAIDWKVYQEHVFSGDRDVVESVQFDVTGKAECVRLEYRIDQNGILSIWKPRLIYDQKRDVETGALRQYDWNDEDPTFLSKEYGI